MAGKFEYQKKYDVNICKQETSLYTGKRVPKAYWISLCLSSDGEQVAQVKFNLYYFITYVARRTYQIAYPMPISKIVPLDLCWVFFFSIHSFLFFKNSVFSAQGDYGVDVI